MRMRMPVPVHAPSHPSRGEPRAMCDGRWAMCACLADRSLEAMLNIADRGGAYVAVQRRPWPGVKNYGEVIGFRNRADGDRWDILIPGHRRELPEGEPLPLRRVLGVVLIKGGNHKLAIELDPPYDIDMDDGERRERVQADIRAFIRVYVRTHPGVSANRIKYLALDQFEF